MFMQNQHGHNITIIMFLKRMTFLRRESFLYRLPSGDSVDGHQDEPQWVINDDNDEDDDDDDDDDDDGDYDDH